MLPVSATWVTGPMRAIIPGAAMGSSAVSPKRRLAGRDGEQVGAEPIDLAEQPGLRGGREAEHRDDRRDADRDAERGEPRAQPPGAHADARDPREVGQVQLPGGRVGGGFTSAVRAAR